MSTTFSFSDTATISMEHVPLSIKQYDNWLVVDSNSSAPVEPQGINPTAVNRLLSFEEADSRCGDGQNLAFQFSDTPFVGIDYDDVADGKEFLADGFAEALIESFDTYTEWSSSGTGCHQIVRGSLSPDHGHRRDMSNPEGAHMEIYESERYFVLTGDLVDGFTEIVAEYANDVRQFHETFFDDVTANNSDVVDLSETQESNAEQVKKTIEEYAKVESHGLHNRAESCLELWESNVERGRGRGSGKGSEKDQQFLLHLLFWCKGDTDLAEACWLSSNRADSKTVTRPDYRERSLTNASTYYSGDYFKGRYV